MINKDTNFLEEMETIVRNSIPFDRQVEIIEFYALAQKYGFCSPYCECSVCA